MPKMGKNRSKKSGLAPGTLVHIGERKSEKLRITEIAFNEEHVIERDIEDVDAYIVSKGNSEKDEGIITWINVDGIHDIEIMEKLGNCFNLHPLVMEDILNTEQRAKLEVYDQYLYIVAKMISCQDSQDEIVTEQLSIIMGENFVITFQEKEGDELSPLRDRLRNGQGRMRKEGADYLLYSILDAVVDNYFVVLEKLGDKIDIEEEVLLEKTTPESLTAIHRLKRELLYMHKLIWPLREVAGLLARGELGLVHETTGIYLRDVYDHIIQIIDIVETYREILSSMLDIYVSSIGNRMNEIMKVLTIISTIFIPLTFLAGVYGMNFKYMPELNLKWTYPALWCFMAVLSMLMLSYFRKKKWI